MSRVSECQSADRQRLDAASQRPRVLGLVLAMAIMAAACGETTTDDAAGAASDLETAAEAATAADAATMDELVNVLRANNLESIASALDGIDLTQLTDSGEFTFFAPSDEAFLALTADETADLLTDPDRILDTVRNHIVTQRIDSAAITADTTVETAAGNTIEISVDGETVRIGDATLTIVDVNVGEAGVVHVVDALLLP